MSEEIIQPEGKPIKPKSKLKWNITAGGAVLALVTFCCGSVASGLIFSSGDDSSPETAAGTTQIAVTQIIAGPSYTPLPTYTNPPPPPPEQILVTPTSSPDFVEVHRFQGNGKSTTDLFSLQDGIIRVKWTHQGSSNFVLQLKRLDTGYEEMLENTIGIADGQTILNVSASDQYLFDVYIGDGPWEIIVEYRP